MKRVLVAFAIGAVAGGCSLVTELDGLTGDAGVPDAPGDVTNGGNDASDAAPDVAVEADADAASDALPTTTCATIDAQLCDDFDDSDGGATFAHWSSTTTLHGATVTRAASDASPPFAADFASVTSDAGTPVGLLKKTFGTAITASASLAFDLRVDHWPSPSSAGLNVVQFNPASGTAGTSLRLRASSSQLEEIVPTDAGNVFPTHTLTTSPTLGQWVHVEIDWSFSQGKIVASVTFDGNVVLAPTTLDASITFGAPTLLVGEVFVDPGDETSSLLVDNVVFAYE